MDEQKNNTTPQEAEHPFIVEITACILTDAMATEESRRHLGNPEILDILPAMIESIIGYIREEQQKDPTLTREKAPFEEVYKRIPGYSPEVDPESQVFDPDAYSDEIERIGVSEFLQSVAKRWAEMVDEQEKIMELFPDISILAYEVQKVIFDAAAITQSEDFNRYIAKQIREAKEKAGLVSVEKDPRIIAKKAEKLLYPLDKPNSKIWNMLAEADTSGQMYFRTGKTKDVLVFYSINFDDLDPALKISKKLTPYDKRVYIAAAALFNAGNDVVTATQIFREMGNSAPPAPDQIQKIWDSLTKMRSAVIQLDNQKETETIKKYGVFKYDGQLLPFERISAYINNTLTDAAIHLFREPPLVSFARQRNQVTTITRKLLESPISKTESNLQLEDYLLERIGHMKKPKSTTSRKILFSTIFENCGIESRSQKSRAPEKIKRYLEWYKKNGWILDYEMQTDGIKIIL